MAKNFQVVLLDSVPMDGPVTVTQAEVSLGLPTSLARIRYIVDGYPQEKGLRFDLDKQVFLDHPEDAQVDQRLRDAAPAIARILESSRLARLSEWVNNPDAQQNLPNWNDPNAGQNLPEQDQWDDELGAHLT